ncbi:hypothetical protein Bca52824_055834 [Brassica carinata]|uniref:Uncharacterized protein n=1 Tax=Brassica carinata TaxID=52824 RepID=A0A8X7R8P6_BRACI|nr:hypothetical protein Bca52824_055834 [Brassica carinata]
MTGYVFTGIHGYAVAGVFLIAGVCFGLYVAFFNKRRRGNDRDSDSSQPKLEVQNRGDERNHRQNRRRCRQKHTYRDNVADEDTVPVASLRSDNDSSSQCH